MIWMVQPDQVERVWPDVEPMLRLANERMPPRRSTADVKQSIADGLTQLWVVVEQGTIVSATTSVVSKFPTKKVCSLLLTAGRNMSDWREPVMKAIEGFAKNEGCDEIEMLGPKGWRRLNPDIEHRGDWLVKELN